GQHLARAVGLGDVAVAARGARLRLVARQSVGGHGDNRNPIQRRISLDAARRLVTVHHRHLDIHQDEVGFVFHRLGDALGAVMRLDHLVARHAEQVAQDLAIVLGILDHEYLLAHWAASLIGTTLIGMVILKFEPLPTSDSTVMRPPCSSTILREIDSPRPVPPFLRVLVLSTCWNSSKILAWSAAAMPGPVSTTDSSKRSPTLSARISTPPWSVNFRALPARLSRTW